MDPKILVPYMNSKDCSQGFCSIYCPQWCYIIFPPPPPSFEFSNDNPSPNLSPLVITIIGILASAFLLVSYYAIISNYCGDVDSSNHEPSQDLEENNHSPSSSLHQPWQPANTGVDEAIIKSITLCKYRKGDGLIEGTECSVCLSEFEEDENLRLMPKCNHAFHVQCIDTWLKSHSNCPLCRANIILLAASPSRFPTQNETNTEGNDGRHVNIIEEIEVVRVYRDVGPLPKTPVIGFSNSGSLQTRNHTIIEIRSEGECEKVTR